MKPVLFSEEDFVIPAWKAVQSEAAVTRDEVSGEN